VLNDLEIIIKQMEKRFSITTIIILVTLKTGHRKSMQKIGYFMERIQEKAYDLAQGLSYAFENNTIKDVAKLKLAHWYNKVENSEFKSFNTIARSIQMHYQTLLNYFNKRSTNASAESFNAKIKEFRTQFRGVRDVKFFLYRLTKLFA
jgi:transposase